MKKRLKSLLGVLVAAVSSAMPSSAEITKADLLPKWRPTVERKIDLIAERCQFYTNGENSLVIFEHGTCVLVQNLLTEAEAFDYAKDKLSNFLKSHPDGNPFEMKDGNFVASAPQVDALSVVLRETLGENSEYIRSHHLEGIPDHEVLMTPLGANVFDEQGMNFLFARAFIFWDSDELRPIRFIPAKETLVGSE